MIKLLTLAVAIYFLFSLAACVSRSAPKAGTASAPTEVMDADFSPDSPVIDAQFTPVPETGEESPCMPVESTQENS